jgi:hypothetical protein
MRLSFILLAGLVPAFPGAGPNAAPLPGTHGVQEPELQGAAEKRQLIAQHMQLTSVEASRFWPVYDRYQRELVVVQQRLASLIADYGQNYDQMTDAKARKLLTERLAIEAERVRLMKAYVPKFEAVISVKRVARYYQIENNIRNAVNAELSEALPLIK